MTVIFILAVILAMFVMYDSGAIMGERIRLQNTTDNVAFSVATLVSRDLNFIAYTNRGMMANQAAIGQMVGLSSWAAMVEQFASNVNEIGQYTPIAPITGAIEQGATAMSDGMDVFAREMIRLNEIVIPVLSIGQVAFHGWTVLAVPEFSAEIAQDNDPNAQSIWSDDDGHSFTEAATLVEDWYQQIGPQYQVPDEDDQEERGKLRQKRYKEFEQAVIGSRDRFTRSRSYEWEDPFSRPDWFPPFPLDWETHKYGGSEFFQSINRDDNTWKWDWAAMDTSGLWMRGCDLEFDPEPEIDCGDWFGDIPFHWAWGAAHVLDESAQDDFHDYGFDESWGLSGYEVHGGRDSARYWGRGAWINEYNSYLLLTSVEPNQLTGDHVHHNLRNIKGLRPFYDFIDDGRNAEDGQEQQKDLGPAIVSLYVKNDQNLGKSRQVLTQHGGVVSEDLNTERDGGVINGRIGAVAKAQPYFSRPSDLSGWARADRLYEHGNLYNPLWQARLIELTDEEKIIATAIVTEDNY